MIKKREKAKKKRKKSEGGRVRKRGVQLQVARCSLGNEEREETAGSSTSTIGHSSRGFNVAWPEHPQRINDHNHIITVISTCADDDIGKPPVLWFPLSVFPIQNVSSQYAHSHSQGGFPRRATVTNPT